MLLCELECTTQTTSFCTKAAIMTHIISTGSTATKAVSASTHCELIYGRSASNSATGVSATTVAVYTPTATRETADNGCAANTYVYPQNSYDVGSIPELLAGYAHVYDRVQVISMGYTVYYWVLMLDRDTMKRLQQSPDVALAYYYEQYCIDRPPNFEPDPTFEYDGDDNYDDHRSVRNCRPPRRCSASRITCRERRFGASIIQCLMCSAGCVVLGGLRRHKQGGFHRVGCGEMSLKSTCT